MHQRPNSDWQPHTTFHAQPRYVAAMPAKEEKQRRDGNASNRSERVGHDIILPNDEQTAGFGQLAFSRTSSTSALANQVQDTPQAKVSASDGEAGTRKESIVVTRPRTQTLHWNARSRSHHGTIRLDDVRLLDDTEICAPSPPTDGSKIWRN